MYVLAGVDHLVRLAEEDGLVLDLFPSPGLRAHSVRSVGRHFVAASVVWLLGCSPSCSSSSLVESRICLEQFVDLIRSKPVPTPARNKCTMRAGPRRIFEVDVCAMLPKLHGSRLLSRLQ